MLSIILNFAMPIFITIISIIFVATSFVRLNKKSDENKIALEQHSAETKYKYIQLERDIVEIKHQIADIPKHKELALLTKNFEKMTDEVDKILVELPDRLKKHNIECANQISNELKKAFHVLLKHELESHGLKLTKK